MADTNEPTTEGTTEKTAGPALRSCAAKELRSEVTSLQEALKARRDALVTETTGLVAGNPELAALLGGCMAGLLDSVELRLACLLRALTEPEHFVAAASVAHEFAHLVQHGDFTPRSGRRRADTKH